MIHRFFISPDRFSDNSVSLPKHITSQIKKVLRLRTGDKICLLDGTGWEYLARLDNISKEEATATLINKEYREHQIRPEIVIGQGLPKWPKMDMVVQKGTELGVTSFVPILMKRSITKVDNSANKIERLRKIVREAAEQTGRATIPTVLEPTQLAQFCQKEKEAVLKIILWEEEKVLSLKNILSASQDIPARIALIVGPEGGITEEEVGIAVENGFAVAGLGENILRTETVPLTLASVIQYHYGNLGG